MVCSSWAWVMGDRDGRCAGRAGCSARAPDRADRSEHPATSHKTRMAAPRVLLDAPKWRRTVRQPHRECGEVLPIRRAMVAKPPPRWLLYSEGDPTAGLCMVVAGAQSRKIFTCPRNVGTRSCSRPGFHLGAPPVSDHQPARCYIPSACTPKLGGLGLA